MGNPTRLEIQHDFFGFWLAEISNLKFGQPLHPKILLFSASPKKNRIRGEDWRGGGDKKKGKRRRGERGGGISAPIFLSITTTSITIIIIIIMIMMMMMMVLMVVVMEREIGAEISPPLSPYLHFPFSPSPPSPPPLFSSHSASLQLAENGGIFVSTKNFKIQNSKFWFFGQPKTKNFQI